MKHLVFVAAAWAGEFLALNTAAADATAKRPEGPGFEFGGAPEYDAPAASRSDREKRALAALDEMTKGAWHLNVIAREGRVLRQRTEAPGAKRVAEIGASSGYWSVMLALGVASSGGKVFTHAVNPAKNKIATKIATANFKKTGVDHLIVIIEGDAHETVKQHKDPIDVVFFDADKDGCVDYLENLLPQVRPGGLVLGHDMHRPMPDLRYIKAITTNPDLDTSFIMMESFEMGMTLKKRQGPGHTTKGARP